MLRGSIPLLTKGPFAMFFGGPPIIPHLSSQSPPLTLVIAFCLSISFQLLILLFKQIKLRKLICSTEILLLKLIIFRKVYSQEQRLKQIIVQNYLNLNKIMFIIFSTIFIFTYILFHFFTIEGNKKIQDESQLTGKTYLAPNGLVILALFETVVQIIPFYQSYALR